MALISQIRATRGVQLLTSAGLAAFRATAGSSKSPIRSLCGW
jgi:hypothetical protein